MEFKEYKLADITEKIYSGGTPSTKEASYWNGELKWLSSGETSNRFIISTEKTITQKGVENSSTKLAFKNDLVMASAGQGYTRGQTSFLKIDTYINQSLIAISVNKDKVHPLYLFYNLISRYAELRQISDSSSTRGSINTKMIKNLNIMIPEKSHQNRIVYLINSIDKKIEINKKIIANLEELSQTLFKHWFVDFEFPDEDGNPYKSSGGEMIDSELGKIPKEWKVSKFNDYIENIIAGDWGKQNEEGNYTCPTRIIRGADLDNFSKGNKGKAPIRYILEKNYKKKKLIAGDIIIEISGGSPTQSTGRTLLIDNNIITYNDKLVSTNFCKVIRPSVNYYSDWINEYLKYLYNRNVFFNYENGTTGIKNLDYKSVLHTMKIISPEIYLIKKFHYQTHKYYNYIQTLGYENKKLQDLRDTLLPKFMSGEIEIPDDVEVNTDELSI